MTQDSVAASETAAKRKATVRRMGPVNSPTWHTILDGAEAILREEGHAALNAKRISEKIGVKRQLIYYYFCDMDELLVQLHKRIADRSLAELRKALDADNPMEATWRAGINTYDQTLILEFMALANRNQQVREAVRSYADAARELQIAAVARSFDSKPLPRIEIPPAAMAFIATWVGLGIRREADLGITNGHREMQKLVEGILDASGDRPSSRPVD